MTLRLYVFLRQTLKNDFLFPILGDNMAKILTLIILTLFLIGCQTEVQQPAGIDDEHDEDIGEMSDDYEDIEEDLDEIEEEIDEAEFLDDIEEEIEEVEEMDEMEIINIVASDWAFTPEIITLKKDVPVKLVIETTGSDHGIAIPELGVLITLPAGETTEIELTPDKVGEFKMFCNVYCGSGHNDMKGTVVVE